MTRRAGGLLGAAGVLVAVAIMVQACGDSSLMQPTPPTPGPPLQNAPPAITALTATPDRIEVTSSPCAGSPSCATKTTLAAAVQDTETPVADLTYEWTEASAPAIGRFDGVGATVVWTAPGTLSAPQTVDLKLTVIDKYASRPGGPIDSENRVSKTVSVRVHDSVREVGDLARQFLVDFSVQLKPPASVVRSFTDSKACKKADELSDAVKNQTCYVNDSYASGTPRVTISFGSSAACAFRLRPGDACAAVPMRWTSTIMKNDGVCAAETSGKAVGTKVTVTGTDWVTAVYDKDQWWLCSSDWDQASGPIWGFKR